MAAAILTLNSRAEQRRLYDLIAALPFVQQIETPVRRLDLWSVEATGETIPDERFGRLCADALLKGMARGDLSFLLFQNIIVAMIAKGRCDRIEIGFLQTIGERL